MLFAGIIFLLLFCMLALAQLVCTFCAFPDCDGVAEHRSGLVSDGVRSGKATHNNERATGPPGTLAAIVRMRVWSEVSNNRQQSVDTGDFCCGVVSTCGPMF